MQNEFVKRGGCDNQIMPYASVACNVSGSCLVGAAAISQVKKRRQAAALLKTN